MNSIVILGAGQIGSAFFKLLSERIAVDNNRLVDKTVHPYYAVSSVFCNSAVYLWDAVQRENVSFVSDFKSLTVEQLAEQLRSVSATHVVNTLPFFLNDHVAAAARSAGCNYIDFTEDDVQAAAVQSIFSGSDLTCAVKCGLAPGFINYVGRSLVDRIDSPVSLMVSVGALPRHVSFTDNPADSYCLSWSIDGLVNEYIRPCQVRLGGVQREIPAIEAVGETQVLIDGVHYEAAFTSGGVGSLIKDLAHVPNIYYKTLRYPGHYKYVRECVARNNGDFAKIRDEFASTFAFCSNDVIVVYAEATGYNKNGQKRREVFAEKFVGGNGLSGIQCTTAGSGLAVLEMMLRGKIFGIVNHADIKLEDFIATEAYEAAYFHK